MAVSEDARYQGAWGELVQRIALRDAIVWNLLAGGIAIMAAISAFEAAREGNSAVRSVAIVVPFFSAVMTLKFMHHELIIGNLVKHLQAFPLDGVNVADTDWFHKANQFGLQAVRHRNWIVLAMVCAQVLLLTWSIRFAWPQNLKQNDYLLLVSTAAVVQIAAICGVVGPAIARMRTHRSDKSSSSAKGNGP